jgi:dynein heavy chain
MLYIQEVLEIWIKVQGMYVYLEPILTFDDINKSLTSESQKFQIVNGIWNENISKLEANPLVLNVYNIPGLLDSLKESLTIMEQIQKALEHHLEVKRIEFPRFFFLSNDELISTLAEARDPVHVQHHLQKCFEGVNSLIFGTKDSEITGVRSKEREEIKFSDKINTKDYKSNIEKWLLRVDEYIKKALIRIFDACLTDLRALKKNRKENLCTSSQEKKKEWIFKYPCQAILCLSSLHWTAQVEEGFSRLTSDP